MGDFTLESLQDRVQQVQPTKTIDTFYQRFLGMSQYQIDDPFLYPFLGFSGLIQTVGLW